MSSVPPFFADFGKKVKDLLTKNFDQKNEVRSLHVLQPDLSIETAIAAGAASELSGSGKLVYKPKLMSVEAEADTQGVVTGTVKLSEVLHNLTLVFKRTDKPSHKVTAEYAAGALATTVSVDASQAAQKGELTAALGLFGGLSIGGQGVYNFTKTQLADFNGGLEYVAPGKSYVLTAKTADKAEQLTASYLHLLNGQATQVGGQFGFHLSSGAHSFALGAQHDFDGKLLVKAKLDTDGNLGTVLEHKLANPALKVRFATLYNVKKYVRPEEFGVGLVFGD